MIESVRIDGYRLLNGFEADFTRLNVVIGANATGKSSLLEALSFFGDAMQWPIDSAISTRGGMSSILNCGGESRELGWRVTISKPSWHEFWRAMPIHDNTRLVYEIKVAPDRTGKISSHYECLRYADPAPGHTQPLKWLFSDDGRAKLFDLRTQRLIPFDQPAPSALPVPPEDAEAELNHAPMLLLAQMRFVNEYPVPTWARGYLSHGCFYPGFEIGRDAPIRTKFSEITPQTTLSAGGENLGTVLHEVLTRNRYRGVAEEINEFLRAAYPRVEDLSAETTYAGEPRILVRVREAGLRRPTEIWELSDGMLQYLLLCAAMLNPSPPSLIFMDEPESGLHPRLLPIVADLIRSAAARTQVIVTTHSPALLNCFNLDDVVVLSREGSMARWYRPGSRQSLRQMLEAVTGDSLGELHQTGELEALS